MLIEREVWVVGKSLEELVQCLLSLFEESLALVVKESRYLLSRERLEEGGRDEVIFL